MHNDREKLYEIKRCCKRIMDQCEYIDDIYQEIKQNLTFQESILFNLIQIGENVNRLSDTLKESHPEVPWRDIVGMRNIITHGYGSVDIDAIAESVYYDVPELYKQCKMLSNLS